MAAVFMSFEKSPQKKEILARWASFEGEAQRLAPAQRSQTVFALF